MEFLFVKDQSEGKISGRTSWKEDTKIRKSLKKRAAALMLDFENNRDLLHRQVLLFLLVLFWIDKMGD